MSNAKELQRKHEKALCDELVKLVLLKAVFVRMGSDTNEPDVIYKLNQKTIGIEVGTAYYDNSDAKQEWTLARGERKFPDIGHEFRWGGVIVNPDNLICSKIQKELDDKCSKKYLNVDITWLCIEVRAGLCDKKFFTGYVSELKIPSSHIFEKIWLFYQAPLHDGCGPRAIKIYG